jgi:peptide/nickel transport system ATP-binding protein
VTPLLEVKDLYVQFDTEDGLVRAVDGVSFTVEGGKTLGIVGESGSGKSVTSLTVMGLTRGPSTSIAGSAVLDGGLDLISATDAQLRAVRGNDVAMIFQDPLSSLHPFYKVGTQLVEAIQTHQKVSRGAAYDRAGQLLQMVGIPEPRKRLQSYPHEFSGGMRQRAMIAMALSNDPRVLIADEPTTALDVTVQAQILELIAQLQADLGMGVVIITHDLGVVAETADEIAVMYAGQIVERGGTDTIFDGPQHPYTWGLLESIPKLTGPREEELIPIPGRPPSLINPPSGCRFHPRCPYVREAHKKTEPGLDAIPGDSDGHLVRCLLAPKTRAELWAKLSAGEEPEQARGEVQLQ